MQMVSHKNVISLFEIYDEPKKMHLVMELVSPNQYIYIYMCIYVYIYIYIYICIYIYIYIYLYVYIYIKNVISLFEIYDEPKKMHLVMELVSTNLYLFIYMYTCIYTHLRQRCILLPLTAATSFEYRGTQCLLILTRSTSHPIDQFPLRVCSCPLCIINRMYVYT